MKTSEGTDFGYNGAATSFPTSGHMNAVCTDVRFNRSMDVQSETARRADNILLHHFAQLEQNCLACCRDTSIQEGVLMYIHLVHDPAPLYIKALSLQPDYSPRWIQQVPRCYTHRFDTLRLLSDDTVSPTLTKITYT